jgi:hypothetical protein
VITGLSWAYVVWLALTGRSRFGETEDHRKIRANKLLLRLGCGEFSSALELRGGLGIAILRPVLSPAENDIFLCAMSWRSTMRELSAETRLHMQALTLSGRTIIRIQKLALYSAFALIAAVVFGSLSVHPF